MSPTICVNDGSFGPGVQGCRDDFDFTQKFERIFFSILPSSIFIAAAIARVAVLSQNPRIVGGLFFQYIKLALIALLCIVQLALLIVFSTGPSGVVHHLTISASVLAFVASLFTIALSYAEHSRARRPSPLINIYFLLTLIFDIVQVRTAWLRITDWHQTTLARLFTSAVAFKFVILCLEAIPKTRWIHWNASDHSPEESSSIFSLGVYFWLNKLFLRGYRGVLSIDDLYPLDNEVSAQNLYDKLAAKLRTNQYRKDPSFGLCKDLAKALTGSLLSPVAPRIALIGFKFCQPFFIDSMLEYLETPDNPSTKNFGYGLIGACFLIYLNIAFSSALYNYYSHRSIYMIRGCLSAAIYRKTTQSKLTAADDAAAVTLMSTDLERIILGCTPAHEVWANTIEVAIGSWLLQRQVGVAFLSPLILITVCAIILAWLLTIVGNKQSKWMDKIQNRVGLTSNAISNMKLYKISGITGPVADLIHKLRVGEIKTGNSFRWLVLTAAVLGFAPLCLSPVITFAVTSAHLDVTKLFTSLSYIILLSNPLIGLFQDLPAIFAALTCLQRIQKFLSDEPRVDFRNSSQVSLLGNSEKTHGEGSGNSPLAFKIDDGDFGWGGPKMTLNQINTAIPAGRLTLVVGQVASGKSTFCKVLLGEVPAASGIVTTFFPPSQIGYCEQTPFLYNTSLKENIIGHCEFDQKRYDEIIDATMLAPDVLLLPDGHDTKIGSDGIMLSGGQKQRVSVARALYSESDVMIFDDVLSGLDNDTEAELFRRVFGPDGITRQRNTTVVICTHSIRHLPTADHIIALDVDGTVIEQGTFEELMQNNKYVQGLGVKQTIEAERSEIEEPAQKTTATIPKPSSSGFKSVLEDKARQQGDWSIYKHYFKTTGIFPALLMFFSSMVYGASTNLSTVWLMFWSEDSFGRPVSFYLGVYGMFLGLKLVFILFTGISTFILMISSSGNHLHKRAITTVVTAPLKFFTTTDSGTVTNLFSQDMTILDGELPESLTNAMLAVADCIGMAFVIASATPYLAISYPFLFAILYLVQMFYLRTSRQLRLLDLESKSPLYTHFLDTIKGVATIRAFGWETQEIERNNKLLDTSQRPAYLLAMIQQWLIATLQLIVTVLAVFITSLATQLRANTGLTGASLVTLLSFSDIISTLIQSYTRLETSLGAVNRLRTFSDTIDPEDQPGEDLEPAEEWPRSGAIEFKNISASYDTNINNIDTSSNGQPNLVIRDLTLSIRPGEKVAICGRTGSGKSTLMMLLLRLLDPLPSGNGSMEIDGTPFNTIDRATLRRRIIAIPQEAVFLPDGSTIKANIDPFGTATPKECHDALAAVQLAHFVEDRGSLDAKMSADDLSAGQKQLFSLGRAILRRRVRERSVGAEKLGGVLLLDEVSSSVDKATDRAMQEIIRAEFETYTIVMVSHRLEMVMDYFDRVVVLDKGALVESGHPRALVATPGSRFGDLWSIENHDSAESE